MYQPTGTLLRVSRVQVTVDPELEQALEELGAEGPRSRAIRDLAMRGAEALRAERKGRREAIEILRRIDTGEDDGFDDEVAAALHRERR